MTSRKFTDVVEIFEVKMMLLCCLLILLMLMLIMQTKAYKFMASHKI